MHSLRVAEDKLHVPHLIFIFSPESNRHLKIIASVLPEAVVHLPLFRCLLDTRTSIIWQGETY